MDDKSYGKKSGGGGSMDTPLSGCEQISKVSKGTGEGPIQSPLDKGHTTASATKGK